MSSYIVNAAPMVIDRGTQDLSTRQLPRVPEDLPQHLPKIYLYTQKGPLTPQLVVGAERTNMYGANSFDVRQKYANHATIFANSINAEGNSCMIQRIVPDDAGPAANMLLSLDVLPTTVDLYERNTDGSIKTNTQGVPIKTTTAAGYKVKWVLSHHSTVSNLNTKFGQATIAPGDQTTGTGESAVQSQRYPIYEFKSANIGEYGNFCGIRLWAPTVKTTKGLPTKMMAQERAFPFYMAMIRRPDANTSPAVVETIFGEQYCLITAKPDVIDPSTDKSIYIGDTLLSSYQNITDLRYPPVYGDFSELAIYQENIDLLLGLFHTAEAPHIDIWSDITVDPVDKHLFNFVSGVSSQGVPYATYQFVDDDASIRPSEYTNILASGGSDGDMNDADFATSVGLKLDEYLDLNSPLQEPAYHVESIFYDSGFPLETKYKIASFISQRHDTFAVLSTHDVNDRIMTASEEHSIAIALRTRLQMYPESDYFGTPVMRAMIVGRCGRLRNSQYTKYLPLSLEIAIKSARYMGAGNGSWKTGYAFDGAPGHVIDYMYDISIVWVPAMIRNRNWDVGLNWVQQYDRRQFFFPAFKTIYSDDTSVLNSYFTAIAICYLNKVGHATWREFSGVSNLTNAQLIERVNTFVTIRCANRFDGRFVIKPDAFMTDMDLLRGYSWTLPIKIYSPNMKTVMTSYVQAYRISDLEA